MFDRLPVPHVHDDRLAHTAEPAGKRGVGLTVHFVYSLLWNQFSDRLVRARLCSTDWQSD